MNFPYIVTIGGREVASFVDYDDALHWFRYNACYHCSHGMNKSPDCFVYDSEMGREVHYSDTDPINPTWAPE